LDIPRAIQATE